MKLVVILWYYFGQIRVRPFKTKTGSRKESSANSSLLLHHHHIQCDQIGRLCKVLGHNFSYCISTNIRQLSWLLWKAFLFSSKLLWLLFGQLLEKNRYFLFQHLVTLSHSHQRNGKVNERMNERTVEQTFQFQAQTFFPRRSPVRESAMVVVVGNSLYFVVGPSRTATKTKKWRFGILSSSVTFRKRVL